MLGDKQMFYKCKIKRCLCTRVYSLTQETADRHGQTIRVYKQTKRQYCSLGLDSVISFQVVLALTTVL